MLGVNHHLELLRRDTLSHQKRLREESKRLLDRETAVDLICLAIGLASLACFASMLCSAMGLPN